MLAEELRKVRDKAGTPIYRAMASKADVSETTLSQADSGKRVPTWPAVVAYLRACGVIEPAELARFKELWEAARQAMPTGPNEPTSTESESPKSSTTEPGATEPTSTGPTTNEPGTTEAGAIGAADAAALTGPEDTLARAVDGASSGPSKARPEQRTGRLLTSWSGALLAGLGVTTGIVGTLVVSNLTGTGSTPAAHPSNAASPSRSPVVVPQHLTLVELSDKVRTTTDPVSAGRYMYLRQRSWRPDSRSPDTGEPDAPYDEQLWWAENNSGRRVTTPDPKSGPPKVQDFVQGELPNPVEVLADDPAILAGQLSAAGGGGQSPVAIVRGVAEVYCYRVPNPAQRAAVLRVLADTEGLKNDGPQPDQLGRYGIGISVTSDNGVSQDTLIFDAETGFLLSYQRASVPPAQVKTQTPNIIVLRLYLDHTYTDQLGQH